jgi:G:T-mismatch repair DNA endonuclease (very short patch repair protein)
MRESKIEEAVCKYAEGLGWTVRKYVTPGHKGAPDRILRRQGVVFWIEFKSPYGGLSALQEREIQRIKNDGFKVYVIDNIEDGKNAIQEMGLAG